MFMVHSFIIRSCVLKIQCFSSYVGFGIIISCGLRILLWFCVILCGFVINRSKRGHRMDTKIFFLEFKILECLATATISPNVFLVTSAFLQDRIS